MLSSEISVGLSVILTALSLVVSIVGWTITYKRQKEILERQIAASIEKEKVTTLLTMNLSDLEKVRSWIHKGFRIVSLIEENQKHENNTAQLIEVEKEWEMETNEILLVSNYLDKRAKSTHLRHEDDYLENFAHIFCNGVISEFKKVVLKEDIKLNAFDIDAGFNALDRIDILTREFLGQPIPNYHSIYEI